MAKDAVDYVNPLIGTGPNPIIDVGWSMSTGNVFPGAVCPRGMIAWSPDTTHNRLIGGGYWYPDDKIEGFSLTHFSGRGVICLKNIAFLPLAQAINLSPGAKLTVYASSFSHANESAEPGYYRVKFDNGVQTELTATPRSGMARFAFPVQAPATLLIRVNGSVKIEGSEVTGFADTKVAKSGQPYKVYFVAEFDKPFKSVQTWNDGAIGAATAVSGSLTGAILTFDPSKNPEVQVRVGMSYTSLDNARDNLKRENNGWDFAAIRKKSAALWNSELDRIQIEGGTENQRTIFYTALYHCFIHPNYLEDANGQYIGMDENLHTVPPGHHQYQNIPAWDQHRSHSPLMAVLDSAESSDVMQSLVNYAQQDASVRPNGGGMPRWQQVNHNSGGMTGDCDDSIISTAYAFGVRGFDVKSAFAAMDKYLKLGYAPGDAATTLEFCNDDFALSQLAKSLGYQAKSADYLKRAQYWKNLFDPSAGYIHARVEDGSWLDGFAPDAEAGFNEGSAAQYVWLVNFNLRSLIEKLGGNEKVVARLDRFFSKLNDGCKSEFAFMGNEPCEEVPWIYDFAGAPSHTQDVARRIQRELFTSRPDGLPGNDDAGSLSSWYVFSALGLYPEIPGVAGFVVGSPVFPKATFHLDNGKTIEIIGGHAAPDSPYVQSLRVNGQSYDSPWIPWSSLSNGASLDFELGSKPSQWGKDPQNAPLSFDASSK
jgi:predicted alpha-1,2-mannosidase